MRGTGDPTSLALEKAVKTSEGRVRGIGKRYGLSTAELDELFQEVRVRLWRALHDPGRIDAVSAAYVHRTATTAAIDLIRSRRHESRALPLEANLPAPPAESPDRLAESRELGEEIHHALSHLDDRQRPVLRMYLSGYNHKDIAEVMGWTEGKARNLLYRGLDELRKALSERSGVAR